jgi:cAMP-dependent protein kinase regulator
MLILMPIPVLMFKDGEAICTQRDATTGHENVVSSLSKGHYFGEVALLEKKHRQATVRVAPKKTLKVLSLDQATFKRILGPLDPILRRNMDNYNKFHARDI